MICPLENMYTKSILSNEIPENYGRSVLFKKGSIFQDEIFIMKLSQKNTFFKRQGTEKRKKDCFIISTGSVTKVYFIVTDISR